MNKSKYFLREALKGARSWQELDMKWLEAQEGVYRVDGAMSRWEMMQTDSEGPGYVRKESGWLTNSQELAKLLEGVCPNQDPDRSSEWHC